MGTFCTGKGQGQALLLGLWSVTLLNNVSMHGSALDRSTLGTKKYLVTVTGIVPSSICPRWWYEPDLMSLALQHDPINSEPTVFFICSTLFPKACLP